RHTEAKKRPALAEKRHVGVMWTSQLRPRRHSQPLSPLDTPISASPSHALLSTAIEYFSALHRRGRALGWRHPFEHGGKQNDDGSREPHGRKHPDRRHAGAL